MQNLSCKTCGGCPLRHLNKEQYETEKLSDFKQIISSVKCSDIKFDAPIFIKDGSRRRADMEFCVDKKGVSLGFNEAKSHNLVDIQICPMLSAKLNALLPNLHDFIKEYCIIKNHNKYNYETNNRKCIFKFCKYIYEQKKNECKNTNTKHSIPCSSFLFKIII